MGRKREPPRTLLGCLLGSCLGQRKQSPQTSQGRKSEGSPSIWSRWDANGSSQIRLKKIKSDRGSECAVAVVMMMLLLVMVGGGGRRRR